MHPREGKANVVEEVSLFTMWALSPVALRDAVEVPVSVWLPACKALRFAWGGIKIAVSVWLPSSDALRIVWGEAVGSVSV